MLRQVPGWKQPGMTLTETPHPAFVMAPANGGMLACPLEA
jgi:hypothetical protein